MRNLKDSLSPHAWPTIIVGLALIAAFLFFPPSAAAGDDGFKIRDIRIEAGGGVTKGATEEVEASTLWRGTLGVDDFPVYLYGQQTEVGGVAIRGQNVSGGKLKSIGLGFERSVARGLSVFVEGGYLTHSFDNRDTIVKEVVYTQLVAEHAVNEYRPVPIMPGTSQQRGREEYQTEWELSTNWEARIGVKYQLTEYGYAALSYRWATADEYYRVYDQAWIDKYGRSWWEEHKQRNLGGIEFTLGVRF